MHRIPSLAEGHAYLHKKPNNAENGSVKTPLGAEPCTGTGNCVDSACTGLTCATCQCSAAGNGSCTCSGGGGGHEVEKLSTAIMKNSHIVKYSVGPGTYTMTATGRAYA